MPDTSPFIKQIWQKSFNSVLNAIKVQIVGSTLTPLVTGNPFSTPGNTRPTVTSSSSTILASNANRKYAYVFNQSGAVIYIKFGAAAVVGEGIRLPNNEMIEITSEKLWTGDVNAIRGAGSGAVEVFEGT